ncbi:DUF6944 family repetitive protein [Texcoconibacillus texcoconensis]|uniref:Uncharacterized protein n=1 Tax=Texcoconibacillus texcoconensis TaxID=1095777 RepID=A0A840QS82_9BACI|nr:hypothetical protein [Texcoconibacillus texcoconensis]MBB5174189.1 hypothetical protein [Texcoconibacillus texcoconensis]
MNDEELILIGSWVDAIGQAVSAIGATGQMQRDEDRDTRLVVIGEAMQSIGNALEGTGTPDMQEALGDWIESGGAGGSSLGASLQLRGDEEGGTRLEILGDSFQALGGAISATTEDDQYLVLANQLQSLGAGLEAIGGTYEVRGLTRRGAMLNTLGSWVQAAGGALQAKVVTEDYLMSDNEQDPSP